MQCQCSANHVMYVYTVMATIFGAFERNDSRRDKTAAPIKQTIGMSGKHDSLARSAADCAVTESNGYRQRVLQSAFTFREILQIPFQRDGRLKGGKTYAVLEGVVKRQMTGVATAQTGKSCPLQSRSYGNPPAMHMQPRRSSEIDRMQESGSTRYTLILAGLSNAGNSK